VSTTTLICRDTLRGGNVDHDDAGLGCVTVGGSPNLPQVDHGDDPTPEVDHPADIGGGAGHRCHIHESDDLADDMDLHP
jgi:hypothetical protein